MHRTYRAAMDTAAVDVSGGLLGLVEHWAGSSNRWEARASVVPFVRKVRGSGELAEEVLRPCEKLIWDEEDIVRKGVGWVLKDNLHPLASQASSIPSPPETLFTDR